MTRALSLIAVVVSILAVGGPGTDVSSADARTEVVVALRTPPLAQEPGRSAELDAEQSAFRTALAERLPEAEIRWSYRLVAECRFSLVARV